MDKTERPAKAVGIAASLRAMLRPALRRLSPSRATEAEEERSHGVIAIAGQLTDPCFIVDRQLRLRYQNPAAAGAFGSMRRGQPISLRLRAPEIADAVEAALESGAPRTFSYFERAPTDRWFEARVSPLGIGMAEAEQPFLLIVLRDLTEVQRVERMRVDFIANVSHELRTPLASLIGFIETLQGPARDDPAARERFLNVMLEQSRRMSRLIDDLISLSRIELKAHVRPDCLVALKPVIEHVAEAMMPLARDSGVELMLQLPPLPLDILGDPDELAQLFQNLVHNAIKYGRDGGKVEVVASRAPRANKPDRISVSVRDHGPGIAEEHVPRLTERFYRVDAAQSRDRGGTGLGLAIVKHILNRHGGRLAIDSAPGQGATFTAHFDAAR